MRRRRLLAVIGMLVSILAVIYVARPAPHIPPYDANLVRLAESEMEGYCAGNTFWKTQGAGNASEASACRKQHSGMSRASDLPAVPPAFCRAIVQSGWDGDVPTCLVIMADNQLWPTYDGSISDQWNRARPYPLSSLGVPGDKRAGDSSRTGGHEGPTRGYAPSR